MPNSQVLITTFSLELFQFGHAEQYFIVPVCSAFKKRRNEKKFQFVYAQGKMKMSPLPRADQSCPSDQTNPHS